MDGWVGVRVHDCIGAIARKKDKGDSGTKRYLGNQPRQVNRKMVGLKKLGGAVEQRKMLKHSELSKTDRAHVESRTSKV